MKSAPLIFTALVMVTVGVATLDLEQSDAANATITFMANTDDYGYVAGGGVTLSVPVGATWIFTHADEGEPYHEVYYRLNGENTYLTFALSNSWESDNLWMGWYYQGDQLISGTDIVSSGTYTVYACWRSSLTVTLTTDNAVLGNPDAYLAGHGGQTFSTFQVPFGAEWAVDDGMPTTGTIYVTATGTNGYYARVEAGATSKGYWDSWVINGSSAFVGSQGVFTTDTVIQGVYSTVPLVTVSFQNDGSGYGTVTPSSYTWVQSTIGNQAFVEYTNTSESRTSYDLRIGTTSYAYAIPEDGDAKYIYGFDGWYIGSTRVNGNITIADGQTYTAHFTRTLRASYTITATVSPAGAGQIVLSTSTIPQGAYWFGNNPLYYSADFLDSAELVATPTPATSSTQIYTFSHWTYNGVRISNFDEITVSGTLTAVFTSTQEQYTLSISADPAGYGDVSPSTLSVYAGSTWTVQLDTIIVSLATSTGSSSGQSSLISAWASTSTSQYTYEFTGWTIGGSTMPSTGTITGDMSIAATFSRSAVASITLNFESSNSSYGTVSPSSATISLLSGTRLNQDVASGAIYIIDATMSEVILSVATPASDTERYTYEFIGWYAENTYVDRITPVDGMVLTAKFVRSSLTEGTYWSNDLYNGKVDFLLSFSGTNTLTFNAPVYVPTTSEGVTTWATSNDLVVSASNSGKISVTVGSQIITETVGRWSSYLLSLDTEHGQITATPVKVMTSYTDYTLYDTQKKVVSDFSSIVSGAAIHDILISDAGGDSVGFSVVSTRCFVDSYGILLQDPIIDLSALFPQYNSIRLNLYSFAYYGDSLTVNGLTWPCSAGQITLQYATIGNSHVVPSMAPNYDTESRSFSLSNFYISYDALTGHAYLTMATERFTLDLGLYSEKTVSMAGSWYFTAAVWSPYTTTQKTVGDWQTLPTTSSAQSILIFLGILAVAGAVIAVRFKRSQLGVLDAVIVGVAAVIGYLLLG